MSAKLKRFTFKAILFAFMSLIFYGCSSTSTTSPVAPAQKAVAGLVADGSGAQPLANAKIIAYKIDAAVAKESGKNVQKVVAKRTPFPDFVPVYTDGRGKFELKIPESHVGAIQLVATSETNPGEEVRSFIPSVSGNKPAIVSPATEMVCKYVDTNGGGIFSLENAQKAVLVLEQLFGPGFNELPPLAVGSLPTKAQQQLFIMTQAIKSMIDSGTPVSELVKIDAATGTIALGGTKFADLSKALAVVVINSISKGSVIPGDFQGANSLVGQMTNSVNDKIKSGDIKLGNYTLSGSTLPPIALSNTVTAEPDLSDVTAPSAPQNLSASVTSYSVTLTWEAASDNVGVAKYFIYRDGAFVSDTTASQLTFTDKFVDPGKPYLYEVKARDLAGNFSAASSVNATTTPVITYTVTGKVTNSDGSPLASVFVTISGSGSGVYVTDASGNYSIAGVRAGNYTITPSLSGYLFAPVNSQITVATENVTGVNFAAIATGTLSGAIDYPPGTIIGGISYPLGNVIGGVTYPTATVVGGVTYPTGTVIGGVTYPNGVVIGGVSYPAGTIVGGVAFPVGALTAGVTYPTGSVSGGVTYPNATIIGGVSYPSGTIIGGVSFPNGIVFGGISYPTGSVTGAIGAVSYSISGQVTKGAVGLLGVTVDLAYAATPTTIIASKTTIFSGEYTFDGLAAGSYSIKASLAGYTLSAPVLVTIDKKNITSQNFTATQQ